MSERALTRCVNGRKSKRSSKSDTSDDPTCDREKLWGCLVVPSFRVISPLSFPLLSSLTGTQWDLERTKEAEERHAANLAQYRGSILTAAPVHREKSGIIAVFDQHGHTTFEAGSISSRMTHCKADSAHVQTYGGIGPCPHQDQSVSTKRSMWIEGQNWKQSGSTCRMCRSCDERPPGGDCCENLHQTH